MGLMNSALQIGRTAILSYQSALQTVGNNISSAASEDYTRLSPQLDPLQGAVTGTLQPGAGVALTGIQRNIDEALESRLRDSIAARESGVTQQDSLSQVESFLDDLSGAGLDGTLRDFFTSFDQLQNTPEDRATRDFTLSAGAQLAESLQSLRARFSNLGADLDSQIASLVTTADEIAQKIGTLNAEIVTSEAGGNGQATGLRDQRDGLLRDLAEIFDTTVREQADGAINVYIGSEALVQGASVRRLAAVEELDGSFVRTTVQFADTAGQVEIRSGRMQGLIVSRDRFAYGQVARVDQLASAIIEDINKIHANGQGLISFDTTTGANGLRATDLALNDPETGLSQTPQDGSFYIVVADDVTQTPVATRIDVSFSTPGSETTLDSLVADINAQVDGVTASIAPGNRLTVTADEGFTFSFGHDGQVARADTSGVLAALGVNTLFEGTDARDIRVSQALIDQPLLLAAATTNHVGDGTNAGLLASAETNDSAALGGASIRDFYNSFVTSVAVASAAARDDMEAASIVHESLNAQREGVSGVNLDEEAIALLKFERAFQGVARYVSVVDGLVRDLVALIR